MKNESLMSKIARAAEEQIKEDVEAANQILRDTGSDPDEIVANGKKLIKRLELQAKARINRERAQQHREEVELGVRNYVLNLMSKSIEELLEVMRRDRLAVGYRSLINAPDKRQIIEALSERERIRLNEQYQQDNPEN